MNKSLDAKIPRISDISGGYDEMALDNFKFASRQHLRCNNSNEIKKKKSKKIQKFRNARGIK